MAVTWNSRYSSVVVHWRDTLRDVQSGTRSVYARRCTARREGGRGARGCPSGDDDDDDDGDGGGRPNAD